MTVPAMPGSGLVVIKAELVLSGFEAVLDRPAVVLNSDQGLDGCSRGAPGREEGEVAVTVLRGTIRNFVCGRA